MDLDEMRLEALKIAREIRPNETDAKAIVEVASSLYAFLRDDPVGRARHLTHPGIGYPGIDEMRLEALNDLAP